jgi:hypothetical protein
MAARLQLAYARPETFWDDRAGRDRRFLAKESKMQLLLLVGSIVLSVGAALGTASLFLSLLLRIMSKLR